MKFGFVVPFADAREFAEIAALGESHGWDGVFTWEAVYGVDAWVSMTAAAMTTRTIRLGTLLTPVPRVRPWDLASRVGTLDRLSGGRVILGAGLGAIHEGWTAFEADEGRRIRAEKLDEALDVYAGLLQGQPFSYEGRHYPVKATDFATPDPPTQQPYPPVWVVGAQVVGRTRQPSLSRAARWQGLLPQIMEGGEVTSVNIDNLAGIIETVRGMRDQAGLPWDGYDVVLEADSTGEWQKTTPNDPAAWADIGVTWWIDSWWSIERSRSGLDEVRRRVRNGPPRM